MQFWTAQVPLSFLSRCDSLDFLRVADIFDNLFDEYPIRSSQLMDE